MLITGDRPSIHESDAILSMDGIFFTERSITDFATRLYMSFVKRHLEASTRRVSDLPGPKRTAEEYLMVYFLEREERAY